MIYRAIVFLCLLISTQVATAQTAKNKQTVKKIIQLSQDKEFVQIAQLFDTTGGKQAINPFLLDYVWRDLKDKYGSFINSSTLKAYTRKKNEYIIEELQFDSGFVDIKMGFNPDNGKLTTYLLTKQQSKADRALEGKYRLPAYANKKNTEVREAKFGNSPFIIEGELTLPIGLKKKDKIPVVILVHGSGPGDRNEKTGPLQAFKDIAYGLAAKGIAVLRYDKRTLTYADDCAEDKHFTVDKETVDDALLAAQYLRTQKNINPDKIFIIGHSLGGMLLPRMGLRDKKLAGLIFMAAPAKSFADKVIEQMDYLSGLYPDDKPEYDRAKEEFVRLKTKWYDTTTAARYLPYNIAPDYWIDLDNYNQTQQVQKIQQPMLFLQGARDYQVTTEDFELWQNALKDNTNTTFRLYSQLNHQMMAGEGKALSTPDEYKIPANVDVEVIDTIVDWIAKH